VLAIPCRSYLVAAWSQSLLTQAAQNSHKEEI
jgi:hypothetical protein